MSEPAELYIVSADHDRAILIDDKQDHNDIAEFFHADHATVGQSYEYALSLAQFLVDRRALIAERDAALRRVDVLHNALVEAHKGIKLLEELTACGSDDDYVWALKKTVEAALGSTTEAVAT